MNSCSPIHDSCNNISFIFLDTSSGMLTSRLQGYIEEPNLASGYIKELCYNYDGRIMCSPFGNGIRLLGFNSNCDELSKCEPNEPRKLVEVGYITSHKHPVLTTRFAQSLPILASGCLGGTVSFYQPKF